MDMSAPTSPEHSYNEGGGSWLVNSPACDPMGPVGLSAYTRHATKVWVVIESGNATASPVEAGYEMVGVTTEQATANLVPALAMGATRYLAIDSPTAARLGWGSGMLEVLRNRGVGCQVLTLGQTEESIQQISDAILARVQATPETPRIYCLGGGTKRHQVALWRVLEARVRAGHRRDRAVYATPENHTTYLASLSDRGGVLHVAEQAIDTGTDLNVRDILLAFNRVGKDATNRNSFPRPLPGPVEGFVTEYARFRSDPDYLRQWLLRIKDSPGGFLAERGGTMADFINAMRDVRGTSVDRCAEQLQNEQVQLHPMRNKRYFEAVTGELFRGRFNREAKFSAPLPRDQLRHLLARAYNEILKGLAGDLGWQKPTPVETPLGSFLKFAQYFEELVIHRTAWLAPQQPRIVEALQNVEVSPVEGGAAEQEHDVLLAMDDATLCSLDAKTFGIEAKDLNSRLLQIISASGRFARFVLVFPFFPEWMNGTEVPTSLRLLPQFCQERKLRFAVVSDSDETFHVRYDNGQVSRCGPSDPGAITCNTLEAFIGSM